RWRASVNAPVKRAVSVTHPTFLFWSGCVNSGLLSHCVSCTGCSSAWKSTAFGTQEPLVQIQSPRLSWCAAGRRGLLEAFSSEGLEPIPRPGARGGSGGRASPGRARAGDRDGGGAGRGARGGRRLGGRRTSRGGPRAPG